MEASSNLTEEFGGDGDGWEIVVPGESEKQQEQRTQLHRIEPHIDKLEDGVVKTTLQRTVAGLRAALGNGTSATTVNTASIDPAVARVATSTAATELHGAHDAIALLLHSVVTEHGFRCVSRGNGGGASARSTAPASKSSSSAAISGFAAPTPRSSPPAPRAVPDSHLAPEGWNGGEGGNQGVWTFEYTHASRPSDTFTLKCLQVEAKLMAHLSHREKGNTASLELEPGAHLARAVGFATDFARAVRPNPGGAEAVRGHLVSALRSGGFDFCLALKGGVGAGGDAGADGGAKGQGTGGHRGGSRDQRSSPMPAPTHPRAPGLASSPGSTTRRGPEHFPSGDFDGDLLPGGGAGAGGLLGPEHPMFGGGGGCEPILGPRFGPGRGPGFLPPGVPPGARFDPYGPGVPVPPMPNFRQGGPRGPPVDPRGPAPFAGPSPDHLRPPGWGGGDSPPDNMYG